MVGGNRESKRRIWRRKFFAVLSRTGRGTVAEREMFTNLALSPDRDNLALNSVRDNRYQPGKISLECRQFDGGCRGKKRRREDYGMSPEKQPETSSST